MISVGRRVQEAIDYMGKGEVELALTAACIALDITSKRHVGASKSKSDHFKKFVQDHLWLITYVGFPGLMASTVRVPFSHPNVTSDAAGAVGIEDIIYHVIRCSLVHSDEHANRIVWNDHIALGLNSEGDLILHRSLVWGILAAIITNKSNAKEEIPSSYWLSIADFKMFISELWGRVDIPKRILQVHTGFEIP
ncbi:hypothetical protein GTP38_19855 [Duganella sp. FT94W]|uniref:Uncharacterized protein n=1 Tax=Duganella lactea TaxID=2692173 RepID=A0ABW9VB09_9BURK|nr:hypothetical protein [Duganella lactea]MYM36588.1 hypothetical protein [Duganella lactea]